MAPISRGFPVAERLVALLRSTRGVCGRPQKEPAPSETEYRSRRQYLATCLVPTCRLGRCSSSSAWAPGSAPCSRGSPFFTLRGSFTDRARSRRCELGRAREGLRVREGLEGERARRIGEHRPGWDRPGLSAAGQADAGALLCGAHTACLLRDRVPNTGVVRRVALLAHGRRALSDVGEALDEGDGGAVRGRGR